MRRATLGVGGRHQRELFALALRIDRKLYRRPPIRNSWIRRSLATPFHLFGAALGLLFLRWPGPALSSAATARIARWKAGRFPPAMAEPSHENLDQARALLSRHPKTAVLFLFSHPPTEGSQSKLLGDLVYHAIQAATFLRPDARFRLAQAIDPFALDSLPWPVGAAYVGMIAMGHLAVDRIPGERTLAQRLWFRKFMFHRVIFRMLESLRRGEVLCAAPGGGVATNTRILYTIREFAGQAWRSSSKTTPRRTMEREMVDCLAADEKSAAVRGFLTGDDQGKLSNLLERFGVSTKNRTKLGAQLENELKMETPPRERLFRALAGRLCRKGVPLLVAAFNHRPDGLVSMGVPVLLEGYDAARDRVRLRRTDEGRNSHEMEQPLAEFAGGFMRDSLNPEVL